MAEDRIYDTSTEFGYAMSRAMIRARDHAFDGAIRVCETLGNSGDHGAAECAEAIRKLKQDCADDDAKEAAATPPFPATKPTL
jgi:hypothetical protein